MPSRDSILSDLETIDDPEMPISIVDLGLIERVEILPHPPNGETGRADVEIDILPTFVGCPALDMIRDLVREKLTARGEINEVKVNFLFDPPWSVDRITEAGRARLKEHGVTVPEHGSRLPVHGAPKFTTQLRTSAVPCPFCESRSTYLDSPFGPTRCRMIYYCEACRNSFEHMKRL